MALWREKKLNGRSNDYAARMGWYRRLEMAFALGGGKEEKKVLSLFEGHIDGWKLNWMNHPEKIIANPLGPTHLHLLMPSRFPHSTLEGKRHESGSDETQRFMLTVYCCCFHCLSFAFLFCALYFAFYLFSFPNSLVRFTQVFFRFGVSEFGRCFINFSSDTLDTTNMKTKKK